jgi:hypothetical protein
VAGAPLICVQGLSFAAASRNDACRRLHLMSTGALSAERAPPQQDLKKDVRQVQAFLAVLLTDSPALPA